MAEAITEGLSIDAVRSDLALDQKFTAVASARRAVMVARDGVNDAPALAAYRAGMGAHRAAAAAAAADVRLLVNQLGRCFRSWIPREGHDSSRWRPYAALSRRHHRRCGRRHY